MGSARIALRPDICVRCEPDFIDFIEPVLARLRASTGWAWEIREGEGQILEFVRADLGEEAFTLSCQGNLLRVMAGHSSGAFYGAQTFLQLLPPAIFQEVPQPDLVWDLPEVEIADAPRFRWRGAMLDSVRHFWPVSYLKKFIDLLAQHKLNVFHWHLTDDQGWRLEIQKYPRLTEIGSRRPGTMLGHYRVGAGTDSVPVEGFYCQEEIRELIEYARRRNVHILPEIEMPGHAQAAVAAYPELGCLPEAKPVSTGWGIHETLFNVEPATLSFLQDVLEEVIALFPFAYVHVGGDEAVKNQWRAHGPTQARMKELGVPDEDHLQSWFIQQMAEFLAARGRKLIGWDEILEGGLPEGTAVMSWRGEQGAVEAAGKGHESVMCAHENYYFDYGQNADARTEPLVIGGCTTVKKVYTFNPIPAALAPEAHPLIIGVQGQLWTEYIATTSRLEYMAFPRLCALAEAGWTKAERRDYEDFRQRLAHHLRRLDCQDVRYHSPIED